MSIQEKKLYVNIISTIGLYLGYCFYVKGYLVSGMENNLELWGKTILIYIPIAVGLKIIAMIIFFILNAIATQGREQEDVEDDERDKLISSKGNMAGYFVVCFGFLLSMLSLVLSWPAYIMINILFLFFNISDITSDVYKLVLYRKGC